MADPDIIAQQRALLQQHRQTLGVYLRQLANLGADHAPPGIHNGIAEARANIASIKAWLREQGQQVDDVLGDEQAPGAGAPRGVSGPIPPVAGSITISGQSIGSSVGVNYGTVTTTIYSGGAPFSDPQAGLAAALPLLETLPLDRVPDPAALPPRSRMPLSRNPLFVGRDAELTKLAAALKPHGSAALIATGIGGVGKTQLAAEFVHRYGQYFAGGVFWLSFADPAGVETEIAACGGAGGLELYTDAAGLTLAEQVARVRQAWAQPIPRLLVFDNCDDTPLVTAEQLLAAHQPATGGCRILVTSRHGHWPRAFGASTHPLDVLTRASSLALLRRHHPNLSDADAGAIAAELGDLPLALSLAGSYLETYRDEPFGQPAAYLANLRAQLLTHRSLQGASAGPSPTNHEQNVRATIALSYDRLDPQNPTDALATAALARAACLAPGEPFPRDLLLATLGAGDDEDADETSAAQRADALRRLIGLGLVEVAEDGALRVHRLIVVFARETIGDQEAQEAVERTLVEVGDNLFDEGLATRLLPYMAHLRYVMAVADGRGDVLAGELANALGRAEEALTNYAAARPLYERVLTIDEQTLGPIHPDIVGGLDNLAALLFAQGDYAAARPVIERGLAITEQALGPSHPDTATSLNNLAYLLLAQGDYAAARPLLERALAITEQMLGPTHPLTAGSLNSLAALLYDQGDYAAARPLYERALAIYEQALGLTHPTTAQVLNNLAELLRAQGEYAAARPLHERALAIREQALGPSHPDTAQSLNNLALLLYAQGDYAAARPLYERALAIYEQALGPSHPDTAKSLNNLALLMQSQGDYAAARPLHERALAIVERQLGPDHATTRTIRVNLAALDAPLQTRERQIAEIAARYESAVAAALADPASDRAALARELEDQARWAEEGESAGSPYRALAARLRALAARLDTRPRPFWKRLLRRGRS